MKTGKFINLGVHNNIKLGYGTIDCKNLKTIYLQLNSWIQPSSFDESDFNKIILFTRRCIREKIYNLKTPYFKQQSIIDLDIKTNGFKPNKRSFMDLEITLYVNNHFDVKSKDIKNMVKNFMVEVIEDTLTDENLFNFHLTKK